MIKECFWNDPIEGQTLHNFAQLASRGRQTQGEWAVLTQYPRAAQDQGDVKFLFSFPVSFSHLFTSFFYSIFPIETDVVSWQFLFRSDI
jgi:hypothetical protein